MKFSIFYRIIGLLLLSATIAFVFSCKPTDPKSTNASNTTTPKERVEVGNAQSPMEAYKMLFKAIRAEDSESIKKMMSAATLKFVEGAAAQSKQTVEQMLKNGLYASTITDKLPDMRDERVLDNFGAVEVWVAKDQIWEDTNYVKEADGWKIAVGDVFGGTFKSPGISQSIKEKQAANANGQGMIPSSIGNANTSASTDPIPKKPTLRNGQK